MHENNVNLLLNFSSFFWSLIHKYYSGNINFGGMTHVILIWFCQKKKKKHKHVGHFLIYFKRYLNMYKYIKKVV